MFVLPACAGEKANQVAAFTPIAGTQSDYDKQGWLCCYRLLGDSKVVIDQNTISYDHICINRR